MRGDLYVMPEEDLTNTTHICNVGTILTDMAYNPVDGEIYAVNADGNLVTVDKLTGECGCGWGDRYSHQHPGLR